MYQPRYLAYCASQGRSPEAQLAHDRQEFPGGVMCGYILWIGAQWAAWDRLVGWPKGAPHSEPEHQQFDAWLAEQFDFKAAA